MDWYREVRELREWVKTYVRYKLALVVKLAPYSRSTADGTGDKVRGYQTEGADEQPYDYDGRRMFPFGLRSMPPKGVDGVWIGLPGDSGNGVIIAAESSRFGPGDLQDGEVALYNKVSGTIIKLDKNGDILITPGSGATVQIAGNAQSAVRGEDLETWLVAHTHPTPVGPSGPPVQMFTPTILSSNVKLA